MAGDSPLKFVWVKIKGIHNMLRSQALLICLAFIAQHVQSFVVSQIGHTLRNTNVAMHSARTTSSSRRGCLHMRDGLFDKSSVINHLERDMKGDLARLSYKFGKFIPSLQDIEEVL
jgi:hypothetical protein